jgi:molybdate transport system permease protein
MFAPLTPQLWQALWLTLRLAFVSTLLLLVLGIPLALWLNRRRTGVATLIEALVTMPIVLPPTVIGFYLLVLFAPEHPVGALWLRMTGDTLVFNFAGLVVGSVLYSLPFAVQPFQAAFKSVPGIYLDAARNLGATRWQMFWTILLPLARRGVGVGTTLSFAHTLGEFGVVLMLGGSIPGKTKVASIALYDEVQKLNYPQAHAYALLLLVLSFALVLAMSIMQRRGSRGF